MVNPKNKKPMRLVFRLICSLFLLAGVIAQSYANERAVNSSPKKIMALAPNLVELLYELEVGDKIVGVSEHSDFPAEAKQLPIVANYLGVQLEKVIEKQPDLVLVWHGTTPQKDIDKLQTLGIKVKEFNASSINDLVSEVVRIGKLVGATQKAEKLAARLQVEHQQIKATRQSLYGPDTSNWPLGFVEIWPEPLTTAGNQTIVGFALSLCGVNNLYSDAGTGYPQASLEKVLKAQPDVIIQPISVTNPTKTKDWSSYSFLDVVKNQAIVRPNADALFRWGPRLTSEIKALCSDIHAVIKN